MNTSFLINDFYAISPLVILLSGALLLLMIEAFLEEFSTRWSAILTVAVFGLAMLAAINAPKTDHPLLISWLRFDGLAHFFNLFFLSIGISSTLLAAAFFQEFRTRQGEYFFLLIASVFGAMLIGSSADFLTLFLGLETLSIALYVLCGYMKNWSLSHEAAIKYFLMSSVATAFLLYGIALVYGSVGSTNFELLLPAFKVLTNPSAVTLFVVGIGMITVGLAFKAAIVPFHSWAPDVYDGAPMPVTAFMAVGTKAAAFAAFIRIFFEAIPAFDPLWNQLIVILACLTLIYANVLALLQTQLRRFFAYSGISHAGFLLIPLAVGTPPALTALLFYLVVYAFATFGCFAALAYLDKRREGVLLSDLKGFYSTSPWLTALMSICLLTLAGIPPTAGFIAKFALLKVAFEAKYYVLVVVGLLMAILSAFYYLRIIAVMLSEAPGGLEKQRRFWPAAAVGTFALISIIALSVYPSPLLTLFEHLYGTALSQ